LQDFHHFVIHRNSNGISFQTRAINNSQFVVEIKIQIVAANFHICVNAFIEPFDAFSNISQSKMIFGNATGAFYDKIGIGRLLFNRH
jgi:hypothetical protein